jgi:UDP:flavonoid glycosyltransferase YjiC (YdhE family)
VVRYLDVIVARPRAMASSGSPPSAGAAAGHVLVIPGGGTGHPGADDAVEQFLGAARRLAASGFETRFVGPIPGAAQGEAASAADGQGCANFQAMGTIPQSDLATLMRSARLIVVNGGSTLLQSIACGAACVAVPIAGDQRERIRRCAALGVAVEAELSATDIAAKAEALLRDEPTRAGLAHRAAGLKLADGVNVALRALGRLIEASQAGSEGRSS